MSPVGEIEAFWTVAPRIAAAETVLSDALGVPRVLAALLIARGLDDPAEADRFLNPSPSHFHDPRLLPDYRGASDALLGARERGETVFVHGDYDVDGVTSAALLTRFLTGRGWKVVPHVPHRIREGYGIHSSAVEAAVLSGAKLFLTCDCGTSAHSQILDATSQGMCVVVTDHHTVGDHPKGVAAFVNPHRKDSEYPFQSLSGAGVAFKLCEGLCTDLGVSVEAYRNAYLDLAVLGTIADVMPLVGENRLIAKFGLERLPQTNKIGLKSLMREAKTPMDGSIDAQTVSFRLAPRLNAAGRIDDADVALRLLMSTDEAEANGMARQIESANEERRRVQAETFEQAIRSIDDSPEPLRNVVVVAHESWHPGVVGIVAGKLVDRYRRPAFVLHIDRESGIAKGSARSIPSFHLANALDANRKWLISGGGHAEAAGVALSIDNLADFIDDLDRYAGKTLTPEDFRPSLAIDFEMTPPEVTLETVRQVDRMKPFGCGNPAPRIVSRRLQVSNLKPTSNPAHTIVEIRTDAGGTIRCPGFNLGERLSRIRVGDAIDIAYEPRVNDFRGMQSVEWTIQDFAASESPTSD